MQYRTDKYIYVYYTPYIPYLHDALGQAKHQVPVYDHHMIQIYKQRGSLSEGERVVSETNS